MNFTPFEPFANFESFQLANGFHVWAGQIPHANQQSFRVVVLAGHYHGPKGLAHFTEHVVASAKGSGEFLKLESQIELLGGQLAAGTTGPTCTYYGETLPLTAYDQIPAQLDRLYKYVFQSSLDYDEIKEKNIFLNEYSRTRTSGNWEKIRDLVYFGHSPNHYLQDPYTSFGNEALIRNRKKQDVADFYKKYYTPANAYLITTGRMSIDQIRGMLDRSAFGQCQVARESPTALPKFELTPPVLGSHCYALADEKFGEVLIRGLFDKDISIAAMWLARTVLSSTCDEFLREGNALTYGAKVFYRDAKDCYELSLAARGIPQQDVDKFDNAIREMFEILEGPVLEGKVQRAKQGILSYHACREYTTPSALREAFDRIEDVGYIYSQTQLVEMIASVPVQTIRKILQQLAPKSGSFYRWVIEKGWSAPKEVPVLDLVQTYQKHVPPSRRPRILVGNSALNLAINAVVAPKSQQK